MSRVSRVKMQNVGVSLTDFINDLNGDLTICLAKYEAFVELIMVFNREVSAIKEVAKQKNIWTDQMDTEYQKFRRQYAEDLIPRTLLTIAREQVMMTLMPRHDEFCKAYNKFKNSGTIISILSTYKYFYQNSDVFNAVRADPSGKDV